LAITERRKIVPAVYQLNQSREWAPRGFFVNLGCADLNTLSVMEQAFGVDLDMVIGVLSPVASGNANVKALHRP